MRRFQETKDARYFEELVRRYRGLIGRACAAILGRGAAAEDVTQEVLTKVWQELPHFEARNFKAWIRVVAHNRCINELKRGFRQHEIPAEGTQDMTAPEAGRDPQKRLEMEEFLARLSGPQRIVMKLFYFDSLTYDEIVAKTGYPANAVKSHIQNGRRMLKKLWGEGANGR